jgi:hypothetical protein
MLPKFEPKSFINALEKYKPTFLHLAPPLLAFCADHDGVTQEALQSIHHVMTAAAPTGPTLLRRFKKKAPDVIVKEGLELNLMIFFCRQTNAELIFGPQAGECLRLHQLVFWHHLTKLWKAHVVLLFQTPSVRLSTSAPGRTCHLRKLVSFASEAHKL